MTTDLGEQTRRDFPILQAPPGGKELAYLDTAASAQKPQMVLDAVRDFYAHEYANIHRGVYALSAQATARYEQARERVRQFIGAASPKEIVFVRGTTEAINLAAHSYGRQQIGAGDEIIITALEHHANLIPWQQLCAEKNARLRVAPINDGGEFQLEQFRALLNPRTKLVAAAHVSNAVGALLPVREIISAAHQCGAAVLLDGAQAAPRFPVNVRELGADFYAFSGHKLYGPSGIGVLYARAELLEHMPPYQTGGGMIERVEFEKTTFAPPPERFEAGTPNIAGAVGLAAALDYLQKIGMENVQQHEAALLEYGEARLREIPGVQIIGDAAQKCGVLSFVLADVHPHDVGSVLDSCGVAVRAGHHCAQPLMRRFGISGTVRASLGVYNRRADFDALADALHKCRELFA